MTPGAPGRIEELFRELQRRGIRLWVDGGRLRFEAPAGALTDDLREAIAARKTEIIGFLTAAAAPAIADAPSIAPARRDAPLPLSFAQQRLWLLEQLEPNRATYHSFASLRLTGDVDVPALAASLSDVVRRHEALRTCFRIVDGQPRQVVQPPFDVVIPVHDLRSTPADRRDAAATAQALLVRDQPFDLVSGPLLRAALIRTADRESLFLLVIHHIACDGWSFGVLLPELGTAYAARVEGREPAIAELPIQYGDYAVWQRDALTGARLESHLAYWRDELKQLPTLELPSDRRRPAVSSGRGAAEVMVLPQTVAGALEGLARRENATLFMVLLAAFDALLARFTGQHDIVVGAPIAGRNRTEVEPLIGFFVNMLVMRADVTADPTFRELLAQVRKRALDAYAHQDLPFEKLVEELHPQRDTSRNPLFQVTLALQNAPIGSPGLGPIAAAFVPLGSETTRFDLEVHAWRQADGLGIKFNYSTDLFDAATIARMLNAFRVLLEGVAADADRRVSALPLLDEASRAQALVDWNRTATEYPAICIHERFEQQARSTPDAVAVECGGASLTYAELDARANQIANELVAAGVGPDTLVGVCLERSIDLIAGVLGILKAGGAYLPLDASYPSKRLVFMLDDAKAPVLLTQASLLARLPAADLVTVCVDRDAASIAARPAIAPVSRTTIDHLAYVTYTSGSTGVPKGVEVRHRGVMRLVFGVDYARFGPDERILQLATIAFDASTMEIWGSLLHGGCCVVYPDAVPTTAALGDAIAKGRITTMWLTASLFNAIVDEAPAILKPLRQLLTGGEALSVAHVQRAYAHLPATRIINGYGPTESTTFTCCHPIPRDREEAASIPIGRPIANTRVYLLDERMAPVPVGVAGELYIAGDGLARGYLNRRDLTAEKFVPDPFSAVPGGRLYRTGDLARWLPNGLVEFIGRIDGQVKVRGFRIELGEIDAAVCRHAGVRQSVTVVLQHGAEKRIVTYVVPADAAVPMAWDGLRSALRDQLPDYMVPSAFVQLDAIPLNANGKIDRAALPEPEAERQVADAYVAPRTRIERTIAEVWRDVLRLDAVGVRDNFFDLGGHSLLLVQAHGRLVERLGRDIPVVDLFQFPTVESLARHLGGDADDDHAGGRDGRRERRRRSSAHGRDEPIAIIAMAGRFPGADDVEAFWRNLREGVESIRFFSEAELREAGVDDRLLADPRYVRARAILDGVDLFDAPLFGYSPREAELIDPQQRLFLECAWEALERAGYDPERYPDRIGVYAGASINTYLLNLMSDPGTLAAAGLQALIGSASDFLPTRVSYKLNLRGPSVNVQTACSTSLVAVHHACASLRAGECEMALAGGVSVGVPVKRGHVHHDGGISSPDGHCRAFDAEARGTVAGNGVGVVVLKRLGEAIADGDNVLAVIRGTAINNDGSAKVGYTAPSLEGQADVIAAAHEAAAVDPATITYVEAHGTGTALGDPIEVAALTRAFGTAREHRCAIGSLKTNVGHLDAAAGVASLIKTVLALRHRELPPSLHFHAPNPDIDFASGPFHVNAALTPWRPDSGPLRAGVSSFGIGGTNAHAVVEEAPELPAASPSRPHQLLVLSARSRTSLDAAAANLARTLTDNAALSLADVAFTLQVGRREMTHRRVVVCRDSAEAARLLSGPDAGLTSTVAAGDRPVVFMFSGQGSQYAAMGRGLYEGEPSFRDDVEDCCRRFEPHVGVDLRALIFGDDGAGTLKETRYAQPALFAVEYAIARLWMRWGVRPAALIGHSIGELVAACIAGVFTLDDAVRVVAARARIMQAQPAGAMLSVAMGEDDLRPLLGPELAIAALNAPSFSVAAGPFDAIAALEALLNGRGVTCRRLETSHAFHSSMMDPAVAEFRRALDGVVLSAPAIPFASNVTGTWITPELATSADYWAGQIRQAVRFADGLATVLDGRAGTLVEVGPGRTLVSLAQQCTQSLDRPARPTVVASLRHPQESQDDRAVLIHALGKVWLSGVRIDWQAFYEGERRHRVVLPTYAFERQRYWLEPQRGTRDARTALAKASDLASWFYTPQWVLSPLPVHTATPAGTWLLFVDDAGVGSAVRERIEAAGGRVVATAFDPALDYDAAVDEMTAAGAAPRRIVHLWNFAGPTEDESGDAATADAFERSFYSILSLTQALARRAAGEPVELTIAGRRLRAVSPQDLVSPARSAVAGLALVIGQEYPNVKVSTVDVEAEARPRDIASLVLDEALAATAGAPVAYRAGGRFTQTYIPAPISARVLGERIRERGVYVVTGGLGGVGLAVAERLARRSARLVLTGRRTLPPRTEWDAPRESSDPIARQIAAVRRLESIGAEVLVVAADVADAAQVQALFEETRRRFGAVHGVVHAAGITRGAGLGVIAGLSREDCERQFRPKVHGVRVLAEAIAAQPDIEFCLLTSSLSCILGGLRLGAYAAANHYMDAFVERCAGRGDVRWISADLDGWQFDEAAAAASPGALAMTAAEGAEALERIIAAGTMNRVAVSTGDLSARIDRYVAVPAARSAPEPASAPSTRHARPELETDYAAPADDIEQTIAEVWQELLGIDQIGRRDNFFDLGGHSLMLVQAHSTLVKRLARPLAVTDLFQFPTIESLAAHVGGERRPLVAAPVAAATAGQTGRNAIAIVGLSCRFPAAAGADAFWANLRDGIEAIRPVTDDDLRKAGVPAAVAADARYVKVASYVDDIDLFDAGFFGYSPREAELLDPQHRLFLECAWESLEQAGYDPRRYRGSIGVFAGASTNSYFNNVASNSATAATAGSLQASISSKADFLPTRVSYKLNLRGPSVNVQTACSTSLVAVHQACRSLVDGECDMALAGGVSINVPDRVGYVHIEDSILSPDGHCRAFDARAHGTVPGAGVGVVVLKRLADALADGDTIHAVVRGTAVNNDGSSKVGYTAPSVEGQAAVVARAQAVAGITPADVTYIEAHGTGTALGDPVEIAALREVFGGKVDRAVPIGSLKTNIGHLDAAAGIAGLIKTTLALQHREIPASLHFESPNPNIDFASAPFAVNTKLSPWNAERRIAGVSSFGIGGTNAHAVLEEAPAPSESGPSRRFQLLTLSARSDASLNAAAARLREHLERNVGIPLPDVAFTLHVGRAEFPHRRIVVCADTADAVRALVGQPPAAGAAGVVEGGEPSCVFMFSGQGAQYAGMLRDLYRDEPSFRANVDDCCTRLVPVLGRDLRELMFAEGEEAQRTLSETRYAQPALFVTEYALAQLWLGFGVRPAALIGHSVGELTAACIAGVFSLDDALALVAARGRLMHEMPGGAMLAVAAPEEDVRKRLVAGVEIAAINGPAQTVVCGPVDAIAGFESQLEGAGVTCHRLRTSHAFHSASMEPAAAAFRDVVSRVTRRAPRVPFVSNLTGSLIADADAMSPDYWARQMRAPVRFGDGIAALAKKTRTIFLEVGPGRTLAGIVRAQAPLPVVSTVRHPDEAQDDQAFLLKALGRLWLAGVAIDWPAFSAGESRRRVPLPTYAFERERYWIEAGTARPVAAPARRAELRDWFAAPLWKRATHSVRAAADVVAEYRRWLVFEDEAGVAAGLADRLRALGAEVVIAAAGTQFLGIRGGRAVVDPARADDYRRLIAELRDGDRLPDAIVHAWTVTRTEGDLESGVLQARGFFSLLFLAQALGECGVSSPLRVAVLTSGAHDVTGGEALSPEKALVLGPARVMPAEYASVSCRTVDLVASEWQAASEPAIDRLLAEISGDGASSPLAIRRGRVWHQTLEPAPLDGAGSSPWRTGGVYLITGGFGGIGLTLAEHLARHAKARIVLVGRSALPDRATWAAHLAAHGDANRVSRQIRAVETIEGAGGEVLLVRADITDETQVRNAVAAARQRFGTIHGVVHAAGVAGGGLIQLKTVDAASRVLAPKVAGTRALASALARERLDFFVLCSSLASLTGGGGQVDYCAANAYLDAFAVANQAATGTATVAINWDAWRDVGMAVETELPGELARRRDMMLAQSISPAEGAEAFARIVAGSMLPQIVVSPAPRTGQQVSSTTAAADSTDAPAAESSSSASVHLRPSLSSAYVAPASDTEKRVAAVWEQMLGVSGIGVHDDFFELGGHSLLAVQIATRLREQLGIELRLQDFFEGSTVAQLSALVDRARPGAGAREEFEIV